MDDVDDSERTPFRAACVQMRSGIDRAKNIADARALIAEASDKGAHFIATPEMTNVVDRDAKRLIGALPPGDDIEEVAAMAAAAEDHGVWLLAGSMAINLGGGKLANRSFLFAPDGSIAARYDKVHMFDVALATGESWMESRIYRPGGEAVVVETPLARFGLSICYDVRFPYLYRAMARAGAEVLCVPAAFTKTTGKAHWKTLLTARAIECGAFVIAPAQGGDHEDGRETYGHSLIISPWGEVLAEARDDAPGVILATVDMAKVAGVRRQIPSLALETPVKVVNLEA